MGNDALELCPSMSRSRGHCRKRIQVRGERWGKVMTTFACWWAWHRLQSVENLIRDMQLCAINIQRFVVNLDGGKHITYQGLWARAKEKARKRGAKKKRPNTKEYPVLSGDAFYPRPELNKDICLRLHAAPRQTSLCFIRVQCSRLQRQGQAIPQAGYPAPTSAGTLPLKNFLY